MQHPDGTVTQTRYLPFGGYRDGSGGNPMTDRGYTGHKHNDDLGLIYMNARFYVPGIARFASADTIVPNPANPQNYNRYSYTRNNPIRLVDPSGHCDLAPGTTPDDRAENMDAGTGWSCWDIYYNLVDQGIPGLNWRWDYTLGKSIEDLAYEYGRLPIAGMLGDIMGYALLSIGSQSVNIDGVPAYYMFMNANAEWEGAKSYANGRLAGVGAMPLAGLLGKPEGLQGYVGKIVRMEGGFSDGSRFATLLADMEGYIRPLAKVILT